MNHKTKTKSAFTQEFLIQFIQYIFVTDDKPPTKEDLMFDAAKKSGKQILSGLSKASLLFTKRMAEGAFNAQMKQSQEEETSGKLKVASQELGKALLRGAVEGGTVGMSSLVEGVGIFSKEMAKHHPDNKDDSDYSIEEA